MTINCIFDEEMIEKMDRDDMVKYAKICNDQLLYANTLLKLYYRLTNDYENTLSYIKASQRLKDDLDELMRTDKRLSEMNEESDKFEDEMFEKYGIINTIM